MDGLYLGSCLISVLCGNVFHQNAFGVLVSIQTYFAVYDFYTTVSDIVEFYRHNYLKKLTFQEILGFFLFVGGGIFKIATKRNLSGVIVITSTLFPKILTRMKKKCDSSGTGFMFLSKIWWYFYNTLKISCFVCDCIKTSFRSVIKILLRMTGQKILLIKAEKAAGLMLIL